MLRYFTIFLFTVVAFCSLEGATWEKRQVELILQCSEGDYNSQIADVRMFVLDDHSCWYFWLDQGSLLEEGDSFWFEDEGGNQGSTTLFSENLKRIGGGRLFGAANSNPLFVESIHSEPVYFSPEDFGINRLVSEQSMEILRDKINEKNLQKLLVRLSNGALYNVTSLIPQRFADPINVVDEIFPELYNCNGWHKLSVSINVDARMFTYIYEPFTRLKDQEVLEIISNGKQVRLSDGVWNVPGCFQGILSTGMEVKDYYWPVDILPSLKEGDS